MKWPFRFYGAQPSEWYGGGRLDYELQFARPPAPTDRTAIAAAVSAIERGFQAVRLDGHDRWSWAQDWAWLIVRTRAMELDWDLFFREIDALFRAVHTAWQLDQVVCRSVDPTPAVPEDAWTAWSVASQQNIGPRPRWRDETHHGAHDRYAPREEPLPVGVEVDPDFETVRLVRR